MALTNTALKNAKPRTKQYRLTDAGNLYCLVMPNKSKLWRMDYSVHGKRKTMALGKYPFVTLKDARAKRDEAKELIAEGVDPILYKKQVNLDKAEIAANTFEVIANDWYGRKEQEWTPGHSRTIRSRMDNDIIPWLGPMPITEITSPMVLKVLRRIEARGARESCKRCRTILSQVFCFAIASGVAENDPAQSVRGALEKHTVKPMAALTNPKKVGGLMRAITAYEGNNITRHALVLSALLFVRPGELRQAEWKEINWIKKEWSIPAEKMKMKRDHVVPLSDRALATLREILPLTRTGKYIFPSLRSNDRPMSSNTILAALRRMDYGKDEMTPHGFRSMASTLLHENGFDHQAIELQLAHSRKDTVAAAYDRSSLMPERKRMMQWWSDHLHKLEHGKVEAQSHG